VLIERTETNSERRCAWIDPVIPDSARNLRMEDLGCQPPMMAMLGDDDDGSNWLDQGWDVVSFIALITSPVGYT
jgi:hypothetical protein